MNRIIIPGSKQKEWNSFIYRARYYDFYHLHSYSAMDSCGRPFLFVAENSGDFIAFPLIVRPIVGTEDYDCTSVYGYAGPISNREVSELPNELITFFNNQLLEYLQEEKIISAFSRLHPILDQSSLLPNLGQIVCLNKTIAIDLGLPRECQKQKYRKNHKRDIIGLKNSGFSVDVAASPEQINSFVEIYKETMRRVCASNHYHFNRDYFNRLLEIDNSSSTILLLAYKDKEVAAGAIFTSANCFMQYHLAGTKEQFKKSSPMKLIIDEACIIGKRMGLRYLHLGGGLNGMEDSLFHFKAGFSDLSFVYKIWKLVINEDRYKELVNGKSKEKNINLNYFPLYRQL